MTVNRAQLLGGQVTELDGSAVGLSKGDPFAVSKRCQHQLADLSQGKVDADGCLVCPWHQARYDVTTGRMVDGPKGFLGYHGPVPGLSAAVKALTVVTPLRVRKVVADVAGALRVEA